MSIRSRENINGDPNLTQENLLKNLLEQPGSIDQAKIHSSAQRPMKIIAPLTKDVIVCPCCSLPSKTKDIIVPFEFTDKIVTFSSTGIGTFLYFYYFQYIIFITIVAMCMAAIPTMIISHQHFSQIKIFCPILDYKDRINTVCKYFPDYIRVIFNLDWLLYFNGEVFENFQSFYNVYYPSFADYNLVNFLTLTVLMIINIFFLILIKNQARLANTINYSPSNFSVLVDNIKDAVKDFKELKNNLPYLKGKSLSETEAFELYLINDEKLDDIRNINLCFNLKELFEIEKGKQEAETMLLEAIYSPKQIELNKKENIVEENNRLYFKGRCCCKKKVPVTKIKEFIKDQNVKIADLIRESTNDSLASFANACFVTFDTIKHRDEYLSLFSKNLYKWIHQFFLNVKYYLCCCFVDKDVKDRYFKKRNLKVHKAPEPEDVQWENLELTFWQRLGRQILIYFISLILITASGGIVFGLNYSQYKADEGLYNENIHVQNVVSFIISIAIMLVNISIQYVLELMTSVITPVFWILNLTLLYKKAKIWWINRKGDISKTQKELNELYELPSMNISFKYSFIVKSIAMTLFYLPIFPLGVPITLIGFIFAYCIEKYNFTRYYKRPEMLNERICLFYMKYFIIILFAYSVGNWIFLSDLFGTIVWALINIIFYGIMILFPYSLFYKLNLIGISEAEINQKTYDSLYFNFSNDYYRMNPMTKAKGMKEYLLRLKSMNMISKEAYGYAIENLNKVNLLEMYYKSSLNLNNYKIGHKIIKASNSLNHNKLNQNSINDLNKENQNNENIINIQPNQASFPLDNQIRNTFAINYPSSNNFNPMQTPRPSEENTELNYNNYPIFNPFMNTAIFDYDFACGNQRQLSAQNKSQLFQSCVYDSNGKSNPNNKDILNAKGESTGKFKNISSRLPNEDYNEFQIIPHSPINASRHESNTKKNVSNQIQSSHKTSQNERNPFDNYKNREKKNDFPNSFNLIQDNIATPGDQSIVPKNIILGPVNSNFINFENQNHSLDKPNTSVRPFNQKIIKDSTLNPIMEQKLDASDIAVSIKLSKIDNETSSNKKKKM